MQPTRHQTAPDDFSKTSLLKSKQNYNETTSFSFHSETKFQQQANNSLFVYSIIIPNFEQQYESANH